MPGKDSATYMLGPHCQDLSCVTPSNQNQVQKHVQINLTACLARCETRNHLWLVLEYCVGGDLMTLLKEEPVLSEDSVHGFSRDIALALQHVHANGLVSVGALHPTPANTANAEAAMRVHRPT